MNEQDLRQLEEASSVTQVAIELGIKVQGNRGRCFKAERHPFAADTMTLYFDTVRNSYFCRVCEDLKGSVIDLVSQFRNVSREEAVSWLEHRLEFDLLTRERYQTKGRKKR